MKFKVIDLKTGEEVTSKYTLYVTADGKIWEDCSCEYDGCGIYEVEDDNYKIEFIKE